jgi:hypothetical protein
MLRVDWDLAGSIADQAALDKPGGKSALRAAIPHGIQAVKRGGESREWR